jgi:ribosomal protein S18 acetylase RimI-like enzyme
MGGHATDHELLTRIGRVAIAAWGLYATRAGGRVIVDRGLTFIIGSHPTAAIINTAFRTDPTVAPADVLGRTRDLYAGLGHGFALVTSDHADADLDSAAEAVGWTMAIKLPSMVCRTPRSGGSAPVGVSIRRADPTADIDSFRSVVRDGFATDEDEIAAAETVFATRAALASPNTVGVLASVDGRDVAVAMVDVIDGVGYVGWVGTLPSFRRRGLGELVTREATNAAFELGANIVALEASPMGLPLYEKMGYETVAIERVWLAPTGGA